MDDLLCKETLEFDIPKNFKTYNDGKYYGDIIIKFIKKYLFLENNDLINTILTKICDQIDNNILKLKSCILALELLLFNTNVYVFELIKCTWSKSRTYLLKEYAYINITDYRNLFKFFLLMIHNCPYFLPYDDNVIPGCNRIFDFDKKRKLSKEPYKKYYENRLYTENCYYYMRVMNWLNKSDHKHFNCYCENLF
tara:strand:- start:1887 stop:2471 length:585 start_codon:yes stop_codon:yes gene_type:complete